MDKFVASFLLAMGLLSGAATPAQADGFSLGLGIDDGCGGGFVGFRVGGHSSHHGCSSCYSHAHYSRHYHHSYGGWEYRTETVQVDGGYWRETRVSGPDGLRVERVYVEPVYETRTVKVWVACR